MKISKQVWSLIKEIPELPVKALRSATGIKEGLDYRAEIGKQVNDYRALTGKRTKAEEVVVLEALELANKVHASGLTSEDMDKLIKAWAKGDLRA